ncbi:hypothetical protein D9613_004557 [Agrocybe pediades]|uniref:Uncharacterized protein n=1 Tax=Agrocybe pediades TaxID=84607 RepID=A0A8H4QIM2_9AGAR|nr:hypothetical protein D9613_004557 [Agrocybe pediades]
MAGETQEPLSKETMAFIVSSGDEMFRERIELETESTNAGVQGRPFGPEQI